MSDQLAALEADMERLAREIAGNLKPDERQIVLAGGPPREEMTDQILLSAQSGCFSSEIMTKAHARSGRLARRMIRKGLWDQRNGCGTPLFQAVRRILNERPQP